MTEKRFKYARNQLGMQFICYDDMDVLLGTFADKDGINHIVTLLNDLSDENEQLKDALNQRTEQCDKYYEENEQLKQTIETQNFNYDNAKSIIHYSENQIRNLKKENEQLKQRITELELLNDGLNYALKNIRKIDVEIDVGDVE